MTAAPTGPSVSEHAGRPSWRQLTLHATALLVVLVALIPIIGGRGGVSYTDEGLYAAQIQAVSRGSWRETRPAIDLPNTQELNGLRPEVISGDEFIGYSRHPLWIFAMTPLFRLAGFAGVLVASALGTAVAALASGVIARRIRPSLALPSLWVTGLTSPLLYDSQLLAAHSIAAAGSAVAVVALLRMSVDRRWASSLGVVIAVLVTVWSRSEGLLAMLALALVATAVGAVMIIRRCRTGAHLIVAGALLGATALCAYWLDGWMNGRITGSATASSGVDRVLGAATGPLSQAWASLLRPWDYLGVGHAEIAFAFLAVLLGALWLRHTRTRPMPTTVLWIAAAAAMLLEQFAGPSPLVTGLFPAFPLLGVGLMLLRRDQMRRPLVVSLLAAAIATTLGVLLTAMKVGGTAEWGGRYFHLIVPWLVPVTLLGLRTALTEVVRPHLRAMVAGLLVISVGLSATSLRTNAWSRDWFDRVTTATVRQVERDRAPGASRPLLIIGGTSASGIGRGFWEYRDRIDILNPVDLTMTFRLVGYAALVGRPEATLLIGLSDTRIRQLAEAWLEPVGWKVRRITPIITTGLRIVDVGPQ